MIKINRIDIELFGYGGNMSKSHGNYMAKKSAPIGTEGYIVIQVVGIGRSRNTYPIAPI
jgi:hypothetical protein